MLVQMLVEEGGAGGRVDGAASTARESEHKLSILAKVSKKTFASMYFASSTSIPSESEESSSSVSGSPPLGALQLRLPTV